MKPAPEKKPHQIREAEAAARAIVEGPFREGARAMREAIVAALVAKTGGTFAAVAAGDTAIPALPEQPDREPAAWQWWAGRDDEWFTIGPRATREEAIDQARDDFDGEGFHVIEATQGAVTLSASRLIEVQYFECDDHFSGEHGEPDRIGGADLIATADAELQALLDGWLSRWRHTFNQPEMFAGTRNAEYVPGQCIDCGRDHGADGEDCPADEQAAA